MSDAGDQRELPDHLTAEMADEEATATGLSERSSTPHFSPTSTTRG